MESNLVHDPNYWGLTALFLGPSVYFLLKEIFMVMDGYKFCLSKGITIGLVPGIGHIAAVTDFFCLFMNCNKFGHHKERNKEDCR